MKTNISINDSNEEKEGEHYFAVKYLSALVWRVTAKLDGDFIA